MKKRFKPQTKHMRWKLRAGTPGALRTTSALNFNYVTDHVPSLMSSVTEQSTFEAQIKSLVDRLQVNRLKAEANLKAIEIDLALAITPGFPHSKVQFFGPSLTGLNGQGDDVDVHIANVQHSVTSEKDVLEKMLKFMRCTPNFKNVHTIVGAKVPIIRCIHKKSDLKCDMNIRNKLSVRNSELIKYYMSLDDKVRLLMMFIKYWFETCRLQNYGYSGYVVYMLVIFYLQQDPYKAPSVRKLQDKCPPEIIDGWNCAFDIAELDTPVLKNESILGLVKGFFRFYAKFDYFNYVICPYVGKPIKKVCFIKPFDLPSSYTRYMSYLHFIGLQVFNPGGGLCLQDPFEHATDIGGISIKFSAKFAVLCEISERITSENESGIMYKLLLNCGRVNWRSHEFEIVKSSDDWDDQKWMDSVKSLVLRILEKIFTYKVETKEENDKFIYKCVGKYDVWLNRAKILKMVLTQLPPGTSEFDIEAAVSEGVKEHFPHEFSAHVVVNLIFSKTPCKVVIGVQGSALYKFIAHIYYFFVIKLQDFLSAELIKNNQEGIGSIGEEEDVPPDFFDDFSKDEFLDGLDIDDLEQVPKSPQEESTISTTVLDTPKSQDHQSSPKSPEKIDEAGCSSSVATVDDRLKSPEKRHQSPIDIPPRSRSRSPRRSRRSSSLSSRSSRTKSREKSNKRSRYKTYYKSRRSKYRRRPRRRTSSSSSSYSSDTSSRSSTSRDQPQKSKRLRSSRSSRESGECSSDSVSSKGKSKKRSRSRSKDLPKRKRKSFLEEILEKLNEVKPTVVQYNQPTMLAFNNLTQPASVPVCNQYFPHNFPNAAMQSYNQNFFGAPYSGPVPFQNNMLTCGRTLVSIPQQPQPQVTFLPTPESEQSARIEEFNSTDLNNQKEEIIPSESAVMEDPPLNPENQKTEVKVITRCEDAIDFMNHNSKFAPRLNQEKPKPRGNGQTPLVKLPHFAFTTPSDTSKETCSFSSALDKILHKVGVLQEVINLEPEEIKEEKAEEEEEESATLEEEEESAVLDEQANTLDLEECGFTRYADAASQWEEEQTENTFVDVGCQWEEDWAKKTADIGVQVNDDELSNTKETAVTSAKKDGSCTDVTSILSEQLKVEEKTDNKVATTQKPLPTPASLLSVETQKGKGLVPKKGLLPRPPLLPHPRRGSTNSFPRPSFPNRLFLLPRCTWSPRRRFL